MRWIAIFTVILLSSTTFLWAQSDPYDWWSANSEEVFRELRNRHLQGMQRLARGNYQWMVNIGIIPTFLQDEQYDEREVFIRILSQLDETIQVLVLRADNEALGLQAMKLIAEDPSLSVPEVLESLEFEQRILEAGDCPGLSALSSSFEEVAPPPVPTSRKLYLEATGYVFDVMQVSYRLHLELEGPRSPEVQHQPSDLLVWTAQVRRHATECMP